MMRPWIIRVLAALGYTVAIGIVWLALLMVSWMLMAPAWMQEGPM